MELGLSYRGGIIEAVNEDAGCVLIRKPGGVTEWVFLPEEPQHPVPPAILPTPASTTSSTRSCGPPVEEPWLVYDKMLGVVPQEWVTSSTSSPSPAPGPEDPDKPLPAVRGPPPIAQSQPPAQSSSSSRNRRRRRRGRGDDSPQLAATATTTTTPEDSVAAPAPTATTTDVDLKPALKRRDKPATPRRTVKFGTVAARMHTRDVGSDGVPSGGGWALGVSDDVVHPHVELGSVDDFEARRRTELEVRAKALPPRQRRAVFASSGFESRQYSHSKEKNPLFAPLPEPRRRAVFVEEYGNSHALLQRNLAATEVLADLRTSRQGSGGCDCHSITRNAKKLSVKRLVEELTARGLDVSDVTTKPRLLSLLRETAKDEKCCAGPLDTCSCAVAGISCHPEVCGCTTKSQRDRCGNPHGLDVYDAEHVQTHRRTLIMDAKRRAHRK